MRYRILISLAILITSRNAFALQESPEDLILRRAVSAVEKAEPVWQFIPAICNCLPLMDEQLGVVAGSWERSVDGSPTQVGVTLYRIATAAAAAQWLSRQAHGEGVANGWTITVYALGDGANMATYAATDRNSTQYSIYFRKGRFVAHINGRSRDTVESFARFLLAEIRDS